MKAQQILLQLFNKLPQYSNFFSTTISIQSLVLSGTTVTATTNSPHGLVINQTVNISGAIIQNPISSLSQTDNIALGETLYDNDLTEGFVPNVTLYGANQTAYNGTFPLLNVLNRRQFTFPVTGNPVTPATGSIFLVENERTINPYNGIKLITGVPSSTTFTYEISSTIFNNPIGTIIASKGLRIGGAMSYDKASEWYSKQSINEYWLFVVLGDSTASKDRYNQDDAVSTTPPNTRYRQRIITPFTCYVFAPSRDDTSIDGVNGRAVRDNMEDVFHSLCKSLLRVKFQTEFSETDWAEVMFTNHGFYGYNQAYYIHQFSFETTYDVTFDDTVSPSDNVAFRDIEIQFQRLQDSYIIATLGINLDDVPL